MIRILSILSTALLAASISFAQSPELEDLKVRISDRDWEEAGFEKLEDATWLDNSANDGDSFHALHDGMRYVFRLYLVDCPETDIRYPDRVAEQAEYFGISSRDAVRLGEDATDFTEDLLSRKSVNIYTKWEDARGAGAQRFYAFVEVDGVLLDMALVANGYARIYGWRTDPPTGDSQDEYLEELAELEEAAKDGELGGWK